MKKKRRIVIICASLILFLTACGGQEGAGDTNTVAKDSKIRYVQGDYFTLPDEDFYDGEILNITDLDRDMKGNPAMYRLDRDRDDNGEAYAEIEENSLNSKGEWDMKVICTKSLSKLFREKEAKGVYDTTALFISRGDDGNLYTLLQFGGEGLEEDGGPFAGRDSAKPDTAQEEQPGVSYSVVRLDEDTDKIRELPLQFDSEKKDMYLSEKVLKFHVFEDGTPLLAFNNSMAVMFDGESGMQTTVDSTVPDGAFNRNVAFGEQDIIYYSSTAKAFGSLDLDSMTVTKNFGGEIEERYKGKEWYYDIRPENSQMYAFNTSGLYQIRELGKTTEVSMLSLEGSFATIEDKTLYDVLVDENEAVYLLVRKEADESTEYEKLWEYGIEKYQKPE